MASEPIPEPLTNQTVKSEEEADFPRTARPGPELVSQAGPPIPADRELPRAPKQEEWKGAIQQKLGAVKETAVQAKDSAARAVREAKEQTVAAVSDATDRVGEIYRDSRDKTVDALQRTKSRARSVVDEYPLHVIAGVAAVAFVAGILLRVWRSSRDA